MKIIATSIFLTLITSVFTQNQKLIIPDSLTPIKIDYEIIEKPFGFDRKKINTDFPKIESWQSGETLRISYLLTDTNKWITVRIWPPDNINPKEVDFFDYKLINLDNAGRPELIVWCDSLNSIQSFTGFSRTKWMTIYDLDSLPTRIFRVSYGFKIRDFSGNDLSYERKIKIKNNSIIITPLRKNKYPSNYCRLTEIPSGTYILHGGKIRKNQ